MPSKRPNFVSGFRGPTSCRVTCASAPATRGLFTLERGFPGLMNRGFTVKLTRLFRF